MASRGRVRYRAYRYTPRRYLKSSDGKRYEDAYYSEDEEEFSTDQEIQTPLRRKKLTSANTSVLKKKIKLSNFLSPVAW
jgi:hypothetical protein